MLILLAGLVYRQLILGNWYSRQEQRQSLRRIVTPGPRGNIYDRHGRLLAGNKARFSLVVYLGELRSEFRRQYIAQVKQARALAEAGTAPLPLQAELSQKARYTVLQRYLDQVNAILNPPVPYTVEAKTLEKHFRQRLLLPMTLIDDLSPEAFARLVEHLPVQSPLQLCTESVRSYPYGSLACHALGTLATPTQGVTDGVGSLDEGFGLPLATFGRSAKTGATGLERSFDAWLQGNAGIEVWQVDPAGFQHRRMHHQPSSQGQALYTSLDLDLQLVAEQALGKYRGAVVLLHIPSGEVLAMASHPGYDLNALSPRIGQETYARIEAQGGWINRAIQGVYAPGSPFKIVTALAALRHGATTPQATCTCTGYYLVGKRPFPCLRRWGHGTLDLKGALCVSCNPFFYEQALKLGIDAFSQEIQRLGFGQKTGIELPFETPYTLVPDPAWKKKRGLGGWSAGDTANLSIGQGYMLVSPLQMVCFMAAFARQETRIQPTILHRSASCSAGEPLGLDAASYASMVEGLEMAALQGTARRAAVPGVRIGGKTGTAQVKVKKGQELDLAWFLGYGPVDKPQVAIVVVVEEKDYEDDFWGGSTAAPIAQKVLSRYFALYPHSEDPAQAALQD
jgi:penicillin-binding protein 2